MPPYIASWRLLPAVADEGGTLLHTVEQLVPTISAPRLPYEQA